MEQKEEKMALDFCANDAIEVCVNPSIDVWIDAVFLGYCDDRSKCFLEIIKKNKENHFMEMDTKHIRFKEDDDDEMKVELNDDQKGKDEWENVSDFVLKEYVMDVFDELSSDLLNSLDEFMRRMEFLGVYSAKSRSRALVILESMKSSKESLKLAQKLEADEKKESELWKQKNKDQNDAFIANEIAQKLADGHTLDTFQCIRCQIQQEFGGIELRFVTYENLLPRSEWC